MLNKQGTVLRNEGVYMKALIIANGHMESLEELEKLVRQHQLIICADGAVRHFRQVGKKPDVVVGDLDSIDQDDLEWVVENNITIERHERRKDYTDTEMAIQYAVRQGVKQITMTGMLGGRLDHTLGNLYLLEYIHDQSIAAAISEKSTEVRIVDNRLDTDWIVGETVSLVPLDLHVSGVFLTGFEYKLENATVNRGGTLCLSNVVNEPSQQVLVKSGRLLAIRNKKQ